MLGQNMAVTTDDSWSEGADPVGQLAAATTNPETADGADVETVLLAAWDGLGAARTCGLLMTGTGAVWRSRQGNAASVEFDWAEQLACTRVIQAQRPVCRLRGWSPPRRRPWRGPRRPSR